MTKAVLELKNICKSFGSVQVLDNINVSVYPGEVLGILGENGAGKSTLLKIISGVYQPSGGELCLDRQSLNKLDPIVANTLGIAMIPQEFNLVPTLSVFENIFLGQELRKHGLLDKASMRRQSQEVLQRLKVALDPDMHVEFLSVAQKQMVEVAKVLINDARIVIMDEPTTVLTDSEVTVLFKVVKQLQSQGVAVLFISHKLKEIKQLCQRLLILRDGAVTANCKVADISETEMANKMVGRELSQIFPEKQLSDGEVTLMVENLSDGKLIRNISFELRRGEILGFAGLIGAGRSEIAQCIMGLRERASGNLFLDGEAVSINAPSQAHDRKIAYLSEDRQGTGLILSFTLPENMSLISLAKYSKGLIQHDRERRQAQNYVEQFSIKTASLSTEVGLLSGGNQQKVCLAKLMDIEPDILILDEPTRGIDVNTKRDIYHFIHKLAQQGKAIMLISSELEEIIGLSHRVLVMREGQIAAQLSGEQISENHIMQYAAGAIDGNTDFVSELTDKPNLSTRPVCSAGA